MVCSTFATRVRRSIKVALAAVLLSAAMPDPALAQGFISPFLGYNYSGDAGCPSFRGCEDKNLNWGVSLGSLGRAAGFELEFGYANDFYGRSEAYSSSVLTLTANFLLAPKFGPVRPYWAIGTGLLRTSVDLTQTSLEGTSNTAFGWDTGGGVMVFFGRNFGLRGEIRFFHSFENSKFFGLIPASDKLDFGRAAAGVVLTF
jgi:opacity protein-like surface antigen